MNKDYYWLVHENDINEFPNITEDNKKTFYENIYNNHIYIGTCTNGLYGVDIRYGCMKYNKNSVKFFRENNYIYKGKFKSLKKIRFKKLKKLQNL